MDYIKEYKSFIGSLYFSEGVRKTTGILVPTLILGHFGYIQIGLLVSMGALCVSITDNPGPFLHRINGFIVCALLVFVFSTLTGFITHNHLLFGILLPIFCFFFSLIGVYGIRAGSIGIAVMLIIVLQTQFSFSGVEILYRNLYMLAGSCWYIILSTALHRIRPYKLAQQALGEYVLSVSEYLKAKAILYEDGIDYDKSTQQLLKTQVTVQEKQNLVTELIFKTRSIVQESTHTGRVLMMAFLDVTDLFEITMASHQNYQKLHKHFAKTNILTEYRQLILSLAGELDKIGIALQIGKKSVYNEEINTYLQKEREHLQELRLSILSPDNVDIFISLKHILDTIDDIATRIQTLHYYTTYDKKLRRKKIQAPDPEDFISHQEIDVKILWDNISFQSNHFRHSLRIALAALSGFLIAQLLHFGHSYWILLTVIVILKPGYSLTKKRNYHRIAGTVLGVIISAVFLFFIKEKIFILIVLAITMIGADSFVRKHYFIGVLLITIYVLLMFHLLGQGSFETIIIDRITDTFIGSALAWAFSYLLLPIWEEDNIEKYMRRILRTDIKYFQLVATKFTGSITTKQSLNVARKNSLIALANLSDAFNRMLSEPKSKQSKIEQVHQFVVSSHMLTSHIATLSQYSNSLEKEFIMDDYSPLITLTQSYLQQAVAILKQTESKAVPSSATNNQIRLLDNKINELMHARQEELKQGVIESSTRKQLSQFKSITDQFYFIYKTTVDIRKISKKIIAKA